MAPTGSVTGVTLSGPLLVSLLHEAGSTSKSHKHPGVRYSEGMLKGRFTRRLMREMGDHNEGTLTSQSEMALESFVRTGGRCSFYDNLGNVDTAKLLAKGESSDMSTWGGMFVVRRGVIGAGLLGRNSLHTIRPTLRELAVHRNLCTIIENNSTTTAPEGARKRPFLLFIVVVNLLPGNNTQSFQYQCLCSSDDGSNGLVALPCHIRSFSHNSAAEYESFRPSPLPTGTLLSGQLGRPNSLQLLLTKGKPPHVLEQELLFDMTQDTLKALVQELREVEDAVTVLELEKEILDEMTA